MLEAAGHEEALVNVTARAASSPWIVSPAFDGAFFLGSAIVVVAIWIATRWFHVGAALVLAVVAVVSNGPHLSATWTRIYLDPRELRQRPWAFLGIPLLIAIAVVVVLSRADDAFRVLTSGVLYWGTWHFASQCYGILRLYQRRNGAAATWTRDAEGFAVFAFAATALAWRTHHGPRFLLGIKPYTPTIPLAVVIGAVLVSVALVASIVVGHGFRHARGDPLAYPRLLFLVAVALGFGVPFCGIADGTAAFAAVACWHGIQYVGLVYHYNRRKFAAAEARGGAVALPTRAVAWSVQPGRAPAYAALLLALAGLVYLLVPAIAAVSGLPPWQVGSAVWVTITFSHDWVDGLIWKLSADDRVRRTLAAAAV